MVVVSPFVAGQKQQNERSPTEIAVDVVSSLSDVTFLQNQAITRGTSLAGGALVAYGSKPRTTGYISHLHKPTPADVKLKTGKGFKPNTRHGLKYTKPYSGIGRSGTSGPATPRHGHYTQDHRSKRGVTQSARRRSPRFVGVGRVLPVLGYGLIVYNISRHGPKKVVKDEARFNWEFSPIGMIDEHVLGNTLENSFLGQSRTGITFQSALNFAIIEALI